MIHFIQLLNMINDRTLFYHFGIELTDDNQLKRVTEFIISGKINTFKNVI